MWPFSLFTRKPVPVPKRTEKAITAEAFLGSFDTKDYLGKAARLSARAKVAVKSKRYEEAWRLLHEQKEEYRKHAARYGMNAQQTISLDASVHEDLANIRRLEGKYDDALVHLLYCTMCSPRITKAQEKKILAYFNRCEFSSVSIDDLQKFTRATESNRDFRVIRNTVSTWYSKK